MSTADLVVFHEFNTDPFVRRYLWDDEVISVDRSRAILEAVESTFSEQGWGLWKILGGEGGVYLGYAGLWRFFDEAQPQLLYALYEHCTGRGYASEAARQIIAYAFNRLDYRHIIASMDRDNGSSMAVCERLGFHKVEERLEEGKPTRFYRLDRYRFRARRRREL